jgi:hypothetical protein
VHAPIIHAYPWLPAQAQTRPSRMQCEDTADCSVNARRSESDSTTLVQTTVPGNYFGEPAPMLIQRSMLFSCIVLAGVSMDAYWLWYSFHFESACSATNEKMPWTVLFTGLSLIPATASLVFRRNLIYVVICLVIWLLYITFQVYLITEGQRFEGYAGVNCYRDVGAGEAVALAFAVFFSAIIIVITIAFGAIYLVRKWLNKGFNARGPG